MVRGVFVRGFVLGFLSGRFARGSFYPFPLLSEYLSFNRKLNITFNFTFHMYDKTIKKCDVTCSWTPSLCHKLSHFLGPLFPLERDVLYGRPLSTEIRLKNLTLLILLLQI